ncbi:outer membrane lipoprotein carrier protein LolA [Pseudotenacibaculum sp. MALMAid0570]|uniref:LolA family protein n=1 Tax=Pseudotenacibaculum sp. MALMAid0570 TaxID=3143938 RepID=UPI0032DE8127
MDRMKRVFTLLLAICYSSIVFSQDGDQAKKLLDEVSNKMGAYTNMQIDFSTSLINKDAGINENDEPPINGKITLQGEKYNLDYLGNTFIFDGKILYVINHDDKEVTVNEDDLTEDDGFIYPSKLLTFYKEGYNYSIGKLENMSGRKIQFVELTPIDSNSEIVKVQLGIDAKTKHIYQLIQTGENGAETTLTINRLKSNQKISELTFQFDKDKYEKLDYLID